jgi:hypothetical protein
LRSDVAAEPMSVIIAQASRKNGVDVGVDVIV